MFHVVQHQAPRNVLQLNGQSTLNSPLNSNQSNNKNTSLTFCKEWTCDWC